jgi:hypothetical protein
VGAKATKRLSKKRSTTIGSNVGVFIQNNDSKVSTLSTALALYSLALMPNEVMRVLIRYFLVCDFARNNSRRVLSLSASAG